MFRLCDSSPPRKLFSDLSDCEVTRLSKLRQDRMPVDRKLLRLQRVTSSSLLVTSVVLPAPEDPEVPSSSRLSCDPQNLHLQPH